MYWETAARFALGEIIHVTDLDIMRMHVTDELNDPWGIGEELERRRFLTIGKWASHHRHMPIQDFLDLLASKQRDYGHGNILKFGIEGVKVRLSDKLERIANLLKRDGGDFDPENEPLMDSYLDVLGYCVIGLMLLDGTFTNELEPF